MDVDGASNWICIPHFHIWRGPDSVDGQDKATCRGAGFGDGAFKLPEARASC